MMIPRKRLRSGFSRKTLVLAFLFVVAATFSATGSAAAAMLCLVPGSLVLDAGRDENDADGSD